MEQICCLHSEVGIEFKLQVGMSDSDYSEMRGMVVMRGIAVIIIIQILYNYLR